MEECEALDPYTEKQIQHRYMLYSRAIANSQVAIPPSPPPQTAQLLILLLYKGKVVLKSLSNVNKATALGARPCAGTSNSCITCSHGRQRFLQHPASPAFPSGDLGQGLKDRR